MKILFLFLLFLSRINYCDAQVSGDETLLSKYPAVLTGMYQHADSFLKKDHILIFWAEANIVKGFYSGIDTVKGDIIYYGSYISQIKYFDNRFSFDLTGVRLSKEPIVDTSDLFRVDIVSERRLVSDYYENQETVRLILGYRFIGGVSKDGLSLCRIAQHYDSKCDEMNFIRQPK